MDKIIRYRQLIQDLLIHYGELINRRPKPDKETEVIFDEERDHYLLITVGWSGQHRLRNTIVYVRIRNAKFWIEEDGLEHGIATDLLAADVPKEDIVLAFQPPVMRPLTEFAVA
ncbi:MAG: XisI protein [Caldilineaceae bacterium]